MCRNLSLFLFFTLPVLGWSQQFDQCTQAFQVNNPVGYCSGVAEFDNRQNTDSGVGQPICFGSPSGDVWMRFSPVATDVVISINGASSIAAGGSLQNPQVALYYRGCTDNTFIELECGQDQSGNNIIEIYQGGLLIGDDYYIRVSGANNNAGTFQLCINNFFAPREPGSDCSTAAILCDQSTFTVESVSGAGFDATELNDAPCYGNLGAGQNNETNSTWFKWVCRTSGTFTFVLTPTNPIDDLDFVLFEMPNGIDDCDNKVIIRCEAAGENPALFPSPCHGPTGLSTSANDVSEPGGCNQGQDNFVAAVDLEAGRAYALIVNNFTSTGNGFTIEFGGNSEFQGPDVDFIIDPNTGLKCEELFSITDSSSFAFGTIENYNWLFGLDANPPSANNVGPHQIAYNSFGDKVITLQVETDRGCIVSATQEFFVEPCCEDLPDLAIDFAAIDLTCFDIPTGSIALSGMGGTPTYKFAVDDGEFDFNNQFENLSAGSYLVKVLDAHGCRDSAQVEITEPEPILVDAGPDINADLGAEVTFSATYAPPGLSVNGSWVSVNGDTIICLDPQCLSIRVIPPGPTDYIITVADMDGCIGMDTVRALVEINRDIYVPNVFSPNLDGVNDRFNLFGNPGARMIQVLRVFDRWGGLLYEEFDVPLNDMNRGWDGSYKGQLVNPGVYAFVAMVEFVDREVIPFSGDITVVR